MSPYYYIKIQPISTTQEFNYPQQEFYYPVKSKNKSKSKSKTKNKHRHTVKCPRPKLTDWVSSWQIWGCVKIICL